MIGRRRQQASGADSFVVAAIAVAAAAILAICLCVLARRCRRTGSDALTSCHRISAEHQRPDDRDNSTTARAALAGGAGWKSGNLRPTSLEIFKARSIGSGHAHPTEHDISFRT